MNTNVESSFCYSDVLHLVIGIVTDYASKDRPSPTIRQLSCKTGYSEECILESLEYGKYESAILLQ